MSPGKRFALNLLGPPPLAALLLITVFAAAGQSLQALALAPFAMVLSYVLAGLPSLAHATLLHLCYKAGLNPHSRLAVTISSGSGTVAGLIIGTSHGANAQNIGILALFAALGAATGAVNGAILFFISAPSPSR